MDTALVRRARDGDRAAFADLAAKVSDRLYALALRVLRDADLAGDAYQAAMVQIWRDLPNLRDPERFEAWAHRVVVHSCYAARRRVRRSIISLEVVPDPDPVGDSQASLATRDELERAFSALNPDQRAVLVLMYYRDLSVSQIAEILGVPGGTVKSRLHHAREAMRAAIEAQSRGPIQERRPA